jgi:hypothetical protein
MRRRERRSLGSVVALVLPLFLAACALIGGFNAKSHEHLTAIKAAHMKLIDTFTAGQGKSFDARKLADESDRIDLKFREALEFSKSLDDKLRTANIELLKEIFEEDLRSIRGKNRLLNDAEAKVLADASDYAYARALKGECARPGAACK